MSVAISEELGTVAGLVVAAGVVVGGMWWMVQRVMHLGEWLGTVGGLRSDLQGLTTSVDALKDELITQRAMVLENSRRLDNLENHLRLPGP